MLKLTFVIGLIVIVSYVLYLGRFRRWHTENTAGNAYFGKSLKERREIRKKIISNAPFIMPFIRFLACFANNPDKMPKTNYQGVTGPMNISSDASFKVGHEYRPTEDDIIVATQMRCGTTWMQQIVFEILHKGEGDLTDSGYGHLNAASAWLECSQHIGVPLAQSPKLGESQKRLLKTHFPASLCPFNEKTKYIYVTRHPVSCYASVKDFIGTVAGPFAPPPEHFLNWYCSDDFFWTSWPHHVDGWWNWAQKHDNVTFIHFEELKNNPAKVIRDIAVFLDVHLSDEELEKVILKSDFSYMQEREEYFEMIQPTVNTVSSSTRFLNGGKDDRHQDSKEHDRETINNFVCDYLAQSSYPLHFYYPDVERSTPKLDKVDSQPQPAV
ncbi:sulfotransferase domain-containing protein [Enterovibrio coralii]|uniref:Sulfotransferase domain-containing protein n=1 Tax=Enterovibrio coralii TaxID=294935 RepID=A0A135IBW7_9GAMM|nr:sulfotransferase domain-containing protein [Enterovibrio coralii]KXF82961.1 hypothetical protein ATN88_04185 [Enterovibrio coralii]